MNTPNINDRVRAITDCTSGLFKKGNEGICVELYLLGVDILFDGLDEPRYANFHEIELIESEPTTQNPFPTFNEFINELVKADPRHKERFCYNYFAQFGKQPSQPNSKPFPWIGEAIDDLKENLFGINTEQFEAIYNYFAQFGLREVFPEVGKEYEFSEDGENWRRDTFESYESNNSIGFTHIRPIQPSRLEQLMEKHPNLTDKEQTELLELLLTQTK